MNNEQPNNPLHGINLKQIVERLVAYYGWEQLGLIIEIGCFNYKPSVTSSLRFLRTTPWARTKVEKLYIAMQEEVEDSMSNSQPQMDADSLLEEQDKSDQNKAEQEQQNPSNIENKTAIQPHKPYRGSQFEPQKSTEPKTPPKFKFKYRNSKGNE